MPFGVTLENIQWHELRTASDLNWACLDLEIACLVGRLMSGPRFVYRTRSGVQVSVSFQNNAHLVGRLDRKVIVYLCDENADIFEVRMTYYGSCAH